MSELKRYSPEVQDIMGMVPAAIVRIGSSVIFFIVLVLLFFSWLIKYPETILSRVVVTTKIPPLEVSMRTSGNLLLYKKDGDFVKQNEVIGYLKNSISYEDVKIIAKDLQILESQVKLKSAVIDDRLINQNLILGPLQVSVINLKQSLYNYNNFKDQFNSTEHILALTRDKQRYIELNRTLERQKLYSTSQLKIAQKRFAIDSSLLIKRVIAPIEFDKTKNSLSQAQSELENTVSQIINNSLQVSKIELQMQQLKQDDSKSKIDLLNQIISSVDAVKSEIAGWEYLNLLKAPTNGTISFQANIVDNQFITMGERLLVINPDSRGLVCTSYIPMEGFGRIAVGQRSIIKLDNFPFADYGSLNGVVKSISPVPVNGTYMVTIGLIDGLKTSYHKNLKFNQEMQGNVEIITEDQRLIERFFNKFRSLLNNN